MTARVPAALAETWLYALLIGSPLAFGCVEPWSRALLELGCFGLALVCLLRPERAAPSKAALGAAAVVLALGAIQRLCPIGPLDARPDRPFTVSAFATDEALLLWSAYAALLWSVPRVARDPDAARRFVRAVLASGALVAALGLAQAALGATELYGLRYVREDASPFGPFYNRDHAADYMALAFAAGVGLLVSRLRQLGASWRAVPPDWARAQALTLGALALLAAGLAYCLSRGALLGLALGGGAVLFSATRFIPGGLARRGSRAALAAAGALGAACVYLAFARELGSSGALEGSVAGRLSLYASGARMLRDAPIFGWGLGAAGLAFGPYQSPEVAGAALYVHNDWLQLALDCGLAGLGLFAAASAAFGLGCLRLWWSARSREMRALIGGAMAALLVFAAHDLVDFCAQVPANAALAAALAGWLSGAGAWAHKDPPAHGRWPRWRWALAAPLTLLSALAARPAVGAWFARQAALSPLERRPALLAKAARWDARAQYAYLMGLAALDLSSARPEAARPAVLAAGLESARAALLLEPLNARYLDLAAELLFRLKRGPESRALAERAQRLRFDPILPERAGEGTAEDGVSALRELGLMPEAGK